MLRIAEPLGVGFFSFFQNFCKPVFSILSSLEFAFLIYNLRDFSMEKIQGDCSIPVGNPKIAASSPGSRGATKQ